MDLVWFTFYLSVFFQKLNGGWACEVWLHMFMFVYISIREICIRCTSCCGNIWHHINFIRRQNLKTTSALQNKYWVLSKHTSTSTQPSTKFRRKPQMPNHLPFPTVPCPSLSCFSLALPALSPLSCRYMPFNEFPCPNLPFLALPCPFFTYLFLPCLPNNLLAYLLLFCMRLNAL